MARMDPGLLERDGFVTTGRLLSRRQCQSLLAHLDSGSRTAPLDWPKGAAVTDGILFSLAADPAIVDWLTPILGKDIVLWGCSLVRSRPGNVHPWHVDIECAQGAGRFAAVWIGLQHTSGNTLQLISGSHRIGRTVQQEQAERGYARGAASTETVLEWARERNSTAAYCEPAVGDGQAIVFDGTLWHASRNDGRRTRSALLLQYASADSPVRIPDPSFTWPFRFLSAPAPPAIMVRGSGNDAVNRLVPPPAAELQKGLPMLSTSIRPLDLPLGEDPDRGWQPHPLFRGSTPVVDSITCHASVLSGGHSPHPPHVHDDEELLIVLDGEAELLIAGKPSYDGARIERVRPGAFAYYPAHQHHTIRNPGETPVTYLMFKWHAGGTKPSAAPLGTTIFHYNEAQPRGEQGFVTETIFEQGTGCLGKLHCHSSRLEPGGGYEPHVDAYDVAILLLSGRVETLGQEVGPHGVIYYSEGQKHGIRNIGAEPAHYLVFEFHPAALDPAQWLRWRAKPFAKRIVKRAARAVGIDPHRLRQRLGFANA